MKMKSIPFWRKILYYFLLVIFLPILIILIIEGLGRATIYVKFGVPGKQYGLWQYDRQLGAIHARSAYNSNSETDNLGFRNREDVLDPKLAGSYRVIAYGGSTTFCYNLKTDDAWPIRLQNLLRDHHKSSDQVLNAGAIMWSISHEITRAERDLPVVKPDYVIIYSGLNEEANALFASLEGKDVATSLEQDKPRVIATNLDQARWLKRNSVIVRYFDYELSAWIAKIWPHDIRGNSPGDKPRNEVDAVVMKYYLRVLREFIDLIKNNGGKPIYVIMGGIPDIGENERRLQYSRSGAQLAQLRGAIVIDAQEVVTRYSGNKRDLFSESGVHWSALGASQLAEFILANVFTVESHR